MTNFEKITATPRALAELLGSVASDAGPWDTAFTERYCKACAAKECTDAVCALPEVYKDPRKMAAWWLGLETEQEKAEEPLDWGKAKEHLDEFKKLYSQLPDGTGCFGLITIGNIERRYEEGERTRWLYDDMMSIE